MFPPFLLCPGSIDKYINISLPRRVEVCSVAAFFSPPFRVNLSGFPGFLGLSCHLLGWFPPPSGQSYPHAPFHCQKVAVSLFAAYLGNSPALSLTLTNCDVVATGLAAKVAKIPGRCCHEVLVAIALR